ncbi:hypothetical protein ABK040_008402 [Willaertia magna]
MKFIALLLLLIITFVCNSDFINGDHPVHCLPENIVNDVWELTISPSVYQMNFKSSPRVPLNCSSLSHDLVPEQEKIRVKLIKPNHVISADDNQEIGTWTMVYDQGFELTIKKGHFTFSLFAFHRFEKVKNSEKIISYCAETMVGNYRKRLIYHSKDDEVYWFGCYYAKKVNPRVNDTITSLPINTLLYKYLDPKNQGKGLNVHGPEESELSDSALFRNENEIISFINQGDFGWKAKFYPHLEKLSIAQVKRMNGAPVREIKAEKKEVEEMADQKDWSELFAQLPVQFDWTNVSGISYVPDVKDQGACGSCYAFATITSIESRIRIKTKNAFKPKLAIQDVISCSPYGQGCHGGIPYAIGRHLKDFDIVPESCFPYKANQNIPCRQKCENPPFRVKVKKYRYVGNYYGGSNEYNMMKEIHENGPIAISYLIYPDFKYYSTGVYKHSGYGYPMKTDRINRTYSGWEPTTHSVVIVGWGELNGEKYWKCLNSWSREWGDKGYFLIKRGTDESAVEAEAVAYDPEVIFSPNHRKL